MPGWAAPARQLVHASSARFASALHPSIRVDVARWIAASTVADERSRVPDERAGTW